MSEANGNSLHSLVGLSGFRCIVADPPWPYGTRDAITRCIKNDGTPALGVGDTQYPFMSMPDLCAMPVASVADDPAHLYLWTTNAFMREAHDLAEAWGFKVKTCLTWGKVKADGTASMKTGYYFRGATEHCLFCVRGSLRLQGMQGRPTLFLSRRLPHSVKPEWFYALCEECSPGPRLELFARRLRLGWTVWGNEVEANAEAQRPALAGTLPPLVGGSV